MSARQEILSGMCCMCVLYYSDICRKIQSQIDRGQSYKYRKFSALCPAAGDWVFIVILLLCLLLID